MNVAKLNQKQGISYLERERGREIDRKIEGRGSKTDDNKNLEQSWVAQLVYNNLKAAKLLT